MKKLAAFASLILLFTFQISLPKVGFFIHHSIGYLAKTSLNEKVSCDPNTCCSTKTHCIVECYSEASIIPASTIVSKSRTLVSNDIYILPPHASLVAISRSHGVSYKQL